MCIHSRCGTSSAHLETGWLTLQCVTKDKTFNIRLSVDDVERLDRLSAHLALSAASVIRMLIKQAADGLPAPAPEKKAKKR